MSGVAFNISSKDVIVTFNNTLLTIPIIINGSGTDNIISFESAEVGDLKPTADGNYIASSKAAIASGKITLCGTSPSLTQFYNLVGQLYALGASVVSTINIANPSNASNYNINTVVITGVPPIPSFAAEMRDVEISFKCAPIANIATLGGVINTATSVAGLF